MLGWETVNIPSNSGTVRTLCKEPTTNGPCEPGCKEESGRGNSQGSFSLSMSLQLFLRYGFGRKSCSRGKYRNVDMILTATESTWWPIKNQREKVRRKGPLPLAA